MKALWQGVVNGSRVRIRESGDNDCIVESHLYLNAQEDPWKATDDELASATYLAAFLDRHNQLTEVGWLANRRRNIEHDPFHHQCIKCECSFDPTSTIHSCT